MKAQYPKGIRMWLKPLNRWNATQGVSKALLRSSSFLRHALTPAQFWRCRRRLSS